MTTPDAPDLLPPGKNCADCKHMARCAFLIQQIPESVTCDWTPSRFEPREEPTHVD